MQNQKEQTITYGLGRFVIDLPAAMQYRGGSYGMRIRAIEEVIWKENDVATSAEAEWEKGLIRIKNLKPVQGKETAIIEKKELDNIGKWCRAIFYYGDAFDAKSGYLDILVNTGQMGVWIKTNGKLSSRQFMYDKSTDLARAYRPPAHRSGKAAIIKDVDSFYLQYGAVDLPFEFKERAGIYLEGHPIEGSLNLEIDTSVLQEAEQTGLINRFEAAIATNYVQGLKIKKIRAAKRTVTGEAGEEFIFLGKEDDGEKGYSFLWQSPGKADSAHHPEISVTMSTGDGKLDEKLALWDAILDSMRPAGR